MIRKNIDLSKDAVKKLRVLAAYLEMDVKNYIQYVVEKHANEHVPYITKTKK